MQLIRDRLADLTRHLLHTDDPEFVRIWSAERDELFCRLVRFETDDEQLCSGCQTWQTDVSVEEAAGGKLRFFCPGCRCNGCDLGASCLCDADTDIDLRVAS